MIIKIDQNTCIGCAVCVSVCGELFELDNGKAQIVEKYRDKKDYAEIEEDIDCAKVAEEDCPVDAIVVK